MPHRQLERLLDDRRRFRASLTITDRAHLQQFADLVDTLASAIRAEGHDGLSEVSAQKLRDLHEQCLESPWLTRELLRRMLYGTRKESA